MILKIGWIDRFQIFHPPLFLKMICKGNYTLTNQSIDIMSLLESLVKSRISKFYYNPLRGYVIVNDEKTFIVNDIKQVHFNLLEILVERAKRGKKSINLAHNIEAFEKAIKINTEDRLQYIKDIIAVARTLEY